LRFLETGSDLTAQLPALLFLISGGLGYNQTQPWLQQQPLFHARIAGTAIRLNEHVLIAKNMICNNRTSPRTIQTSAAHAMMAMACSVKSSR
jgi:hypothetical protein